MYIQVISDFYEIKDIVFEAITGEVARKLDTCFAKFREAIDKQSVENKENGNTNQLENKVKTEQMKRFEEFCQENTKKLSGLFDSKLTEIIEKFFQQDAVAAKIKHLVNVQTQEALIYPTIEANQEVEKVIANDLENFHKEVKESLKIKESQLNTLNETLKERTIKCSSEQVILMKVSLFYDFCDF